MRSSKCDHWEHHLREGEGGRGAERERSTELNTELKKTATAAMAAVAASAAAPVDGLDDGGDQGGGGEEEVHSGSTQHAMRGNLPMEYFYSFRI